MKEKLILTLSVCISSYSYEFLVLRVFKICYIPFVDVQLRSVLELGLIKCFP